MVGIHSDAVQAFQLDTIHHKIALRQRNDLLVDLNESDLPQGQASPIAQLIMADRKIVGVASIENGGKDRRMATANGQ